MAKIVIYEDERTDLVNRYASLLKQHEVWAFLLEDAGSRESRTPSQFETTVRLLEAEGFDRARIQGELPILHPEADAYFLDGLNGQCLGILPYLPKERTYINSGSAWVRNEVMKMGYCVIHPVDVERIAAELGSLGSFKSKI